MMGPPTDVLLEVPVVQEANYREGFVFCQQFCQHYANSFQNVDTTIEKKNQTLLVSWPLAQWELQQIVTANSQLTSSLKRKRPIPEKGLFFVNSFVVNFKVSCQFKDKELT